MKLGEFELPRYLLKFCEKREYAEELLKGKLYMKESGYFRRLEDTYRGDVNDGVKPIDMTGKTVIIESIGSNKVKIPLDNIMNFRLGFEGDKKTPVFCASMMDDDILEKIDNTSCKYRDEFLSELSKFGEYVVIISYDEFIMKIQAKIEEKNDLAALFSKVKYVDIMKEYDFPVCDDFEGIESQYRQFFNKDKSYKWQNEFRLLLLGKHNNELINSSNDSYVLDIGEFKYALMTTVDILKGIIKVEGDL